MFCVTDRTALPQNRIETLTGSQDEITIKNNKDTLFYRIYYNYKKNLFKIKLILTKSHIK